MTTPRQPNWYVMNSMHMATLCAGREDAEACTAEYDKQYPLLAPHRAVQLVEVSGCGIGRGEILSMAREAGFSVRGETIRTMHSSGAWVGINDQLDKFATQATTKERTARIEAQVEKEALKAERASSGLAHRKAVQEAVREAEDAAKLATATACADVCTDMAQQLRGHGDAAGAEIAEALRDAIRARGAS